MNDNKSKEPMRPYEEAFELSCAAASRQLTAKPWGCSLDDHLVMDEPLLTYRKAIADALRRLEEAYQKVRFFR